MDAPLIAAGCLALLAACVHGGVGEVIVIRRLERETLPTSRYGGARMTEAMIHVTWHLTTVAFFAVACALLLAGTVLGGDTARGSALVAAGAATGFAAVAMGLGLAHMRTPRKLFRHPAPLILSLTAALAWWGALL